MTTLSITSCLAANIEPVGRHLAAYLSERLGMPAGFVDDIDWQERERRLDAGEIEIGWLCGLLYTWKAADRPVDLLAAPVMAASRYANRPIYYSDVIVHRDSPFQTFADLNGVVWAYNEPRSYSGYHLVRAYLAATGRANNFFGGVVASGSHHESIRLVVERQADASAIDSTVLEHELAQNSELREQLRVVAALGPSPSPPLAVFGQLPAEQQQRLRQLLVTMHQDRHGRNVLATGGLARFALIADRDYDLMRRAYELGRAVQW